MFGSREKRPEKEHSGPCGLSLRLNVLYCPFRDAPPTINPITSSPPRERHTNPYALNIGRQALAIVGCTGRTARRRFIALRISDKLLRTGFPLGDSERKSWVGLRCAFSATI